MVTSRRISRFLLDRFAAEAADAKGHEICGLLLGQASDIMDGVQLPNVAKDPQRHFLIDPRAHLRLSREARSRGLSIVGCYHSHPSGDPSPSPLDASQAASPGFLWLIIARGAVRLWISTGSSDPTHAFDPVDLVEPSPCNMAPQAPIGA